MVKLGALAYSRYLLQLCNVSLDSINDVVDHIPLQEVNLGRVFHNEATQRQTDFIHHNSVTRHHCLEGGREGGRERGRERGEERRGSKEEREGCVNSVCRNSHVSTTY